MRRPTRRQGALAAGALALLVGTVPAISQPTPMNGDPQRAPSGDWSMYGGNPQRTFATGDVSITEDTVFRLKKKWRFAVPNPSFSNSVTASPTVYDGLVYFGDWEGTFYAVDAVDGHLVWKVDLVADLVATLEATLSSDAWALDDRAIPVYSTALAYDGVIYTGVNQLMYALDADTGAIKWRLNLMDPVTRRHGDVTAGFFSSPTVAFNPSLGRDVIYVGAPSIDCVRGVLRAVDPGEPKILWSYYVDGGTETTGGELTPEGRPAMGGGIWTSPALSPDGATAYITTSNACGIPAQPSLAPALIAVDTAAGPMGSPDRIRWVAQPRSYDIDDQAIANTPNYMQNVVTPSGTTVDLVGFADKDGSYQAYFATDVDGTGRGKRLWRTDVAPTGREVGGIVGGGTGYANGKVVVGSFLGPPFLHAFDAFSGDIDWQSLLAGPTFGGVGIANDLVFKGDELTPGIKVYDAADGSLLRVLLAPETSAGAPAIVDRHVFATLGSARPWEGLPTHPNGIGVVAYYLPDSGLLNQIPPIDPNPPLPSVPIL